MPEPKKSLTGSEWNLMSALWGSEPQMLSEIVARLEGRTGWGYSTYVTHLGRLCQKGVVAYHTRGGRRFYYPKYSMDECIRAESRSIKNRLSDEAAGKLLIHMLRDTKLTEDDRRELRALVNRLEDET